MIRSFVLTFALLATGVAVAQNNNNNNNPANPNLPANTQPPLPGSNAIPPNPDPASTYAAVPPTFAPLPPNAARHPDTVHVSGRVMAAEVQNKVAPVYPEKARSERIEGAVVLAVRIGKDGTVRDAEVLSGPAALRDAAANAVKQWTYKVYRLNGRAVEVMTKVTVTFHLEPDSNPS